MRVSISTCRQLILQALINSGYDQLAAEIVCETLLYAELRGNNQGIVKLVAKALSPHPSQQPSRIVHSTPISARIHGGQQIGMVLLHQCVDLALEKARSHGMGIVGVSGYSSATGALGCWARKITDQGMIGIVLSQCNEMVAPYGSYEPIFGTNPFAIGIPTKPRAQILDMATSAIAYYGVKTAELAGKPIPGDVAYDEHGQCTTDPTAALRGALRVFDRGYKGSHLALMVELLAGAFTGAAMEEKTKSENWGSLVLAISPMVMGDEEGFLDQAQLMCGRVKGAKQLPQQHGTIYLPGERGDELEEENLAAGSIEVEEEVWRKLTVMAEEKIKDPK